MRNVTKGMIFYNVKFIKENTLHEGLCATSAATGVTRDILLLVYVAIIIFIF